MCKVSIIIPCYNVKKNLIHRCLSSIDAQMYTDYEVIIVDDGSESGYSEVFLEIERRYKNVKIFHQENQGVSAARNNGLKKAQGEYIVFADADDYLAPEYLNEALGIANEYNADLVIGLNTTTFSDGIENKELFSGTSIGVYSDEETEQLNKLMLGKVHYYSKDAYLGQGPWNRMVSRELACNILFDESLPIGEDIVWNLQLLQKAKRVCLVDRIWYIYYMNPTSSSRKYRIDAIDESYRSLNEIKKYLNLDDNEQYLSYCLRCWSDLKRIFRCYLSYNQKADRRQEKILYSRSPWDELATRRFIKVCGRNGWFMRTLYSMRLLFVYYRIKSTVSGSIDKWK